jgi:hypothetical protein
MVALGYGTDPVCLPRRAPGNLGVGGLVAGLPGWWLLRPLTSHGTSGTGLPERADPDPVCQRQLAGAATTATPTRLPAQDSTS